MILANSFHDVSDISSKKLVIIFWVYFFAPTWMIRKFVDDD